MTSHSFSRFLLLISVSGAAVFVLHQVRACGPDFPNSYLSNSIDEITTLPTLSFERELARLLPAPPSPRPPAADRARELAAAEIAEVREALARTGLSEPAIEAAVAGYRRDDPPVLLAREFQLYAKGARAWHENRSDDALVAWRELLALPAPERHYRTVWAAYMMGRALWDSNPEHARSACRLARAAAAQGFADSQELAIASLGWEARSHLRERNYALALKCYFDQFALGDPSAVPSLQLTLQRVFHGAAGGTAADDAVQEGGVGRGEGPESASVLAALVSHKEVRGVVTAWFAARGGPLLSWSRDAAQQFALWIRSLPSAKNLSPEEADRWCWAAYQNGLWNEAGTLAALAPADAPASEWVRAMLLLRSGFVDDAAVHLGNAARSFAADPALAGMIVVSWADSGASRCEWQPLQDVPSAQLGGVRGMLALRREQYAEALRLFLVADHWSDAAYVAERVLTIDELVAFVRSECPDMPTTFGLRDFPGRRDLRHLLARRLVRAGRFDDAREFFPQALAAVYASYLVNVRAGFDEKEPAGRRADALWAAAETLHELGMEIQGTELAPDFSIWGGNFEWPDLEGCRGCALAGSGPADLTFLVRWNREGSVLGPTNDELTRARKAKVPERRFHYRYRAAELAWLSAVLLPNDDPKTALILNTAGRWIAVRDPEQAELFYKTLVIRCPNTDLGRIAAETHWFVRSADGAHREL
jgi:hypothetical protein